MNRCCNPSGPALGQIEMNEPGEAKLEFSEKLID